MSIAKVIDALPKECLRHIVVSNNGSKDGTKQVSLEKGAIVVDQMNKGYGNACLKGIEYLDKLTPHPDIVVFIDGDYSDYPEQLPKLVQPIIEEGKDLVIGSRVRGDLEQGSMTIPQVFGNWLATLLIRIIYGYKFTDLGPFRAIKWDKLKMINMVDRNYGWTVEMQIKAAKYKFAVEEIPVDYRKRIGTSKVSGTIKGTILAGYKIIWTIFKLL